MAAPYREAPDLGKLVSVHRSRGGGCVIVGLASLVAILGAWMIFMGLPLWQGGAYLLLAIVGGWVVLRWRERKGPYLLELYERGLVERAGTAMTSIRFDAVTSVTRDCRQTYRDAIPVLRTEVHVVEAGDGSRVRFGLLHDRARDLLAAIIGQVMPRLRADAIRAFDEGKAVRFGPFTLNGEGLRVADEVLVPWADVARAAVHAPSFASQNETIHVEKASGTLYAERSVSLVPNIDVMLEMIELARDAERDTPE